jgi:hypothetical protein
MGKGCSIKIVRIHYLGVSDRIILIWKITKSIQNISGLDFQVLQRIKTSLYKDLEQKGLMFEIYTNT